ncbi:MAG TPA: acyl-CoA dehydrogenase family protein [Hyphomicrobiaceae bacterium]|nr:acyl-CoA dehydrogenase family protein [Hyphomicrobiaceae bacterium]
MTGAPAFSPLDDANFNQSPIFQDVNLFTLDGPLQDAVNRAGANTKALAQFGRTWGYSLTFEDGRLANENPPKLRTSDAKGHRLDLVEFHPSYHALMTRSTTTGLHCSAFEGDDEREPAAVSARAARQYMAVGVEAGHMCPITMTHAAIPVLKTQAPADLRERVLPLLVKRKYDSRPLPWFEKDAITVGMGMTERQGGTDVRANTTRAEHSGGEARITGHKWFMSAPMCDAFLVLAQGEGGLSCYFLPRHRPDGQPNGLRFRRLKPKLGNHSNASSEVEFFDAHAVPLGAPGRGVATIIEMVQWTRLDCAVSSAGLMRMALAEAIQHVRHRAVFQRKLVDQPAMRAVLADMALELEAIVALVFRLTQAFDRKDVSPADAAYARLMTPVVKYLVCKRAPAFIYEAMECLGGNGYVEELPLARLYREAPLNAIWEGSGNVMALDMLRAFARQSDDAAAVVADLFRAASDVDRDLGGLAAKLNHAIRSGEAETRARATAETLGKIAAVAALAEARSSAASRYARIRLLGLPSMFYGSANIDTADADQLIDRAFQA